MKPLAALLALVLCAGQVNAGPLREPKQCNIFWRNIERVTSWTAETKNKLYWQCLQRAMDYRLASRMSIEDATKLRESWLLTPTATTPAQEEGR